MRANETTFHIGIDFDHTIVDYGNIFAERASNLGYLEAGVERTKDEVKKLIKKSDEGDKKWGILQAEVYSEGIRRAKVMEGFQVFVEECQKHHIPVIIISHKGKSNPHDIQKRNLQQPALDWMKNNHFFDKNGFGFDLNQIVFSETLEGKIAKIEALNCSHFVDDLITVLHHPSFPENTQMIHFTRESANDYSRSVDCSGNWRNIHDYLLQEIETYDT